MDRIEPQSQGFRHGLGAVDEEVEVLEETEDAEVPGAAQEQQPFARRGAGRPLEGPADGEVDGGRGAEQSGETPVAVGIEDVARGEQPGGAGARAPEHQEDSQDAREEDVEDECVEEHDDAGGF